MNRAEMPAPVSSPVSALGLACLAGRSWPLGASCITLDGHVGVNFAVYSRHAEAIELCLFDDHGAQETARIRLPTHRDGVWHGFVPGLQPGQLYGLRAHGPYQPAHGQRFNPAKLLIDPFARSLVGPTQQLSLELDYLGTPTAKAGVLVAAPDLHDNASRMPKAQVLDLAFELQAGAAISPGPGVPLANTVLYEAHVKGLTKLHPDVPAALRGTYAGLVSAPMLAHYQRLGVTTLCLLPVQLFVTEAHLLKRGLRNYWGYNTLGYFIPEPAYASGQFANDRTEFRHMVDQLHQHGLEVVLDVVYNHSAESDTFGPTLSWRGLDNASWYALDHAGQYLNFSGCGNSFNPAQPCTVQLVMDSLRWWVQAFGVDGFRFDLATSLGRDPLLHHNFHPMSGLLTAIGQDAVLAGTKLIAEPWDVGSNGYQLGKFPARWHEWNDRFRDASRAFWLGHQGSRGELARRLTGSSDCFHHDGRSPMASVNLLSAHDGMTLADLTTYRHKHNLANGEDNRDGQDQNFSANAGVEGPCDHAAVLSMRGQWQRALLATLFCSQGLPQLLAGDELGQSQRGNNNAYCQDNETSWLAWPGAHPELTEFVAGLIHLRQTHAALRHPHWFTGHANGGATEADIAWRRPDGSAMAASDWDDPQSRSFAGLIEVTDAVEVTPLRWLLLLHAGDEAMTFSLPPGRWQKVLDSASGWALPDAQWDAAPACTRAIIAAPRTVLALVQQLSQSVSPPEVQT